MKKQVNIRLSEYAITILKTQSEKLAISQAAIIELALREFEKLQGANNATKTRN